MQNNEASALSEDHQRGS